MGLGKLWWREVFCTYRRQRGEQAWLNSGGVKKCYKAWWGMSSDWQGKLWSRSSAVLCRKSDHEAPAWVSPPITYVLCRDLLYVIKGLFFPPVCPPLQCFGELQVERNEKEVGKLLPETTCMYYFTCPERVCLLRQCLSNTLKCGSPSSVTVTVWFPEEVRQSWIEEVGFATGSQKAMLEVKQEVRSAAQRFWTLLC